MMIYRIAWFVQSAVSFASHVEHFFAEIENHFMCLLAASQAHSFAQRLSELTTSQRENNDVLHSSWCDRLVEYLRRKLFEIKSMSKKTKETRFFYVFKAKFTSLFTSRYELRYLLINDIIAINIQMTTKNFHAKSFNKDSCTSNSIFNIYHAFFYTNKIFSNNKQVLRIRYLIMSYEVNKYLHFRWQSSRSH
jgi:hypothetical protein